MTVLQLVTILAGDLVKPPPATKRIFHFSDSVNSGRIPKRMLGCPFVVRGGTDGRLVNEYIQARWRGLWSPSLRRALTQQERAEFPAKLDPFQLAIAKRKGRRPKAQSFDVIARNVDDFVGWWRATTELCDSDDDDLRDRLALVQEDVIEAYGDAMGTGEWSNDGIPLSNTTIGQRQIDALNFLSWAKFQGMAPDLLISTVERKLPLATYSGAQRQVIREQISVIRRPDPRRIIFPDEVQVGAHVASILDPAAQIGGMLAYGCGLRLREIVELPNDAIETARSGKQRYLRVTGKRNKTRLVELEPFLFDKIRFYQQFDRVLRLKVWGDDSKFLLLREDGSKFTTKSFYRSFRNAGNISPHLARHWYAVNFLVQAADDYRSKTGHFPRNPEIELQTELLRLQANLGHAQHETTLIYLVSLSQRLHPISLQRAFEQRLNDA